MINKLFKATMVKYAFRYFCFKIFIKEKKCEHIFHIATPPNVLHIMEKNSKP